MRCGYFPLRYFLILRLPIFINKSATLSSCPHTDQKVLLIVLIFAAIFGRFSLPNRSHVGWRWCQYFKMPQMVLYVYQTTHGLRKNIFCNVFNSCLRSISERSTKGHLGSRCINDILLMTQLPKSKNTYSYVYVIWSFSLRVRAFSHKTFSGLACLL